MFNFKNMSTLFKISRIWNVLLCLAMFSCVGTTTEEKYYNDLGEIRFDEKLDDINFKVCHEDYTFPFNYGGVGLVYTGEKRELEKTYFDNYKNTRIEGQTGFITIRFIINCEGKAGRFRVEEMDLNLEPKKFDDTISTQIINITKSLDGWQAYEYEGITYDYQQYLTIKIEDGRLKDVLP